MATFPAIAGEDLGAPTILRRLERWPTAKALANASTEDLVGWSRRPEVAAAVGGAAGTRGNDLPDVSHVNQGHEGVAVGVQPEALDPVVSDRNELAVVNAGAVSQGDAHAAALEVSDELGHSSTAHGFPSIDPFGVADRAETTPVTLPP